MEFIQSGCVAVKQNSADQTKRIVSNMVSASTYLFVFWHQFKFQSSVEALS